MKRQNDQLPKGKQTWAARRGSSTDTQLSQSLANKDAWGVDALEDNSNVITPGGASSRIREPCARLT
jgi:hypothetical protein